ncbi:hypothetical protein Tco_1400322, partial [Tanacetum coccineum]
SSTSCEVFGISRANVDEFVGVCAVSVVVVDTLVSNDSELQDDDYLKESSYTYVHLVSTRTDPGCALFSLQDSDDINRNTKVN